MGKLTASTIIQDIQLHPFLNKLTAPCDNCFMTPYSRLHALPVLVSDRARDPCQMVGRGVSVFVYDKRGTGLSEGDYTQNLPRLADDLVAASPTAKKLAEGRYGRFGLFSLSQGGWIAPPAAARAKAKFLRIGYGLVVDIAEQDAAQVARQLRDLRMVFDAL